MPFGLLVLGWADGSVWNQHFPTADQPNFCWCVQAVPQVFRVGRELGKYRRLQLSGRLLRQRIYRWQRVLQAMPYRVRVQEVGIHAGFASLTARILAHER